MKSRKYLLLLPSDMHTLLDLRLFRLLDIRRI